MLSVRTFVPQLVLAAAVTLLASACGGSSNSNSSPTTASESGAAQTVSVRRIAGVGEVLVDSKGDTLYSAAQEAGGKVHCSGSCTSIWVPLTLPTGERPTADTPLASKLGIVERPDRVTQVTFDGEPLYRFADDSAPGTVSGNGVSDSFGGTSFTWHVATTAATPGGSSSTTPQGGYSY